VGEHVEMHMFLGRIKKGISLKGYYDKKLVYTNLIKKRYDDLVIEMISRDMKHNTPIEEIDFFKDFQYGGIDLEANINELMSRCPKCKDMFINK
jgi:hypothetical protein